MTITRIALSRKEAAAAVGVSQATISAAIATGALRARRTGEKGLGNYMIRPADLEAWIDGLEEA